MEKSPSPQRNQLNYSKPQSPRNINNDNNNSQNNSSNPVKKSQGHNQFKFNIKNEFGYSSELVFDSNFDSGSLMKVDKINNHHFVLSTSPDLPLPPGQLNTHKNWFYFSVKGFQNNQTVKFQIKKVNTLWAVVKTPEIYKIVYKVKNGDWKRLDVPVQINKDDFIDITFEYQFQNSNELVYFAYHYPFGYTECQNYCNTLYNNYKNDPEIYFHKEIMIKSYQNRNIDLLTISSHEGKQNTEEDQFDQNMFPDIQNTKRAVKFRNNKPVILISARVHPLETPASFAFNGVVKFLLDKKDARAMLIRKYFVVKLVPMLNPDGVYNGHYRMDTFGQNLNRFYVNPDLEKQPSCYAIRKLSEYLNINKRLFFYCDLHAHPGRKGCFFYGNAVDDYVMQVESQLFAKTMSLNCINFEYDDCNFSKKHMKSKDKNEAISKEGSGRVNLYKIANLIHSYTLECGFHMSNYVQELPHPNSTHRKYTTTDTNKVYGYCDDEIENIHAELYRNGPPLYTQEIFENIGKNLMVSILDIFEKNPYTRIANSTYKNMDTLRKEVAQQVYKLDRFKKEEPKLMTKCKKVTEYIFEQFYSTFIKNRCFDVDNIGRKSKSSKKSTRVIKYNGSKGSNGSNYGNRKSIGGIHAVQQNQNNELIL